jgi:hypothetical protein
LASPSSNSTKKTKRRLRLSGRRPRTKERTRAVRKRSKKASLDPDPETRPSRKEQDLRAIPMMRVALISTKRGRKGRKKRKRIEPRKKKEASQKARKKKRREIDPKSVKKRRKKRRRKRRRSRRKWNPSPKKGECPSTNQNCRRNPLH